VGYCILFGPDSVITQFTSTFPVFVFRLSLEGVLGCRSGLGAALLFGRSRDRFPVVSLDVSVTYSFRPFHGSGVDVDLAPSEYEYQEYFLGVKAAGA
jgi:hypothetical protein